MSINQEFLELLRCPLTQQALVNCNKEVIEALNTSIDNGTLKNKKGIIIQDRIKDALYSDSCNSVYLVNNQIPVLLVDEAIELA